MYKRQPYIVVPGALEMINIGPEEQLRPGQADKVRYYHNPSLLKIRADKRDMRALAELFVHRLGDAAGNTRLVIPTQGFSEIDKAGNVFYDPETDAVFTSEVKAKMPPQVPVITKDCHLNDPAFAELLVRELIRMIDWDAVRRGEAHA